MTVTAQAALLGAVLGLAIALITGRFLPARASLGDSVRILAGADVDTDTAAAALGSPASDLPSSVGARLYPHLTGVRGFTVPTADLAILNIGIYKHIGNKTLSALIGLAMPAVIQAMLALAGRPLPTPIPVFLSLALAGGLFIAPDLEIRAKAAAAREEFGRSLGAFIEFVVLNRRGGVGSVQALERAATVGDSWVFRRLATELDKSALLGKLPWANLERLSQELVLPELGDLVKTMTLTGEQGASVSSNLESTASTLRNGHLTKELGDSDSATTKMQAPLALMAVIFILLLAGAAAGNIMLLGV